MFFHERQSFPAQNLLAKLCHNHGMIRSLTVLFSLLFLGLSSCSEEDLAEVASVAGGGDGGGGGGRVIVLQNDNQRGGSCFDVVGGELVNYFERDGTGAPCPKDVTTPANATRIAPQAFSDSPLSSIVFHDNVTEVERFTYLGLGDFLTSITLGSGLSVLPTWGLNLYGRSGPTSITIPSNITKVESQAFGQNYGINPLTSICIRADSADIDVTSDSFPPGATVTYNCTD